MEMAIRSIRAGRSGLRWWRVYIVTHHEYGPNAQVLRNEDGGIRRFHSEENARDLIRQFPDAVEVEHPYGDGP